MKTFLILFIIFNIFVFAADQNTTMKKNTIDKHLVKQMEKEKKYAKEQKFYSEKNYDFKGAEVDEKSLDSIPVIKPENDFNMDSVYD